MISVLIPIYNCNVLDLVSEINNQLIKSKVDYEIICIDDNSSEFISENLELNNFKNVNFIQLTKNIGRSKIRNLLVEEATHNFLLFLDADVMPKSSEFIANYLESIKNKKNIVVCGGILYQLVCPSKAKKLRWTYGRKREEVDCEKRSNNPYSLFLSANFLIDKSIFNSIKFNETITKYGHEDSVFVEDLRNNRVVTDHIENGVYHLGIEENSVFLTKTLQAIDNLKFIYKNKLINIDNNKVLKTYNLLKSYNLNWVFNLIWKRFNENMASNLRGSNPSIFLFDVYKLAYFCFILNKNSK